MKLPKNSLTQKLMASATSLEKEKDPNVKEGNAKKNIKEASILPDDDFDNDNNANSKHQAQKDLESSDFVENNDRDDNAMTNDSYADSDTKKEPDEDEAKKGEEGKIGLSSGLLSSLFETAQKVRNNKIAQQKNNTNTKSDANTSKPTNKSGTENSSNGPLNRSATQLRLAFLGGGSFGTAMSNLAAKNGCDSTLWVRNKRTVKSLQKSRINKKYLPKYVLDDHLKFEHDLKTAVQNKDIIFVAVPSSAFRETLQKIAPYITGQSIVSLTKGMEKNTFALMSDIITEELPEVNFGVMSGPNLAVEIMQNMPSASVIASDSEPLRHAVQSALHSAFFRVFASDDVRGVELGGALKNIYAIAMGMAVAHNVGENTKAMLLTRGLAEMSRFGAASGANPLTFLGLAGVGDLYATCNSELSRNFRIGNMLGKGISLDSAIKKLGQTAEGVNTIQQVHEKATKLGIYMPITHALYAVIFDDQAALGVALHLMETGFRSDVEFVMPHEHSNDALNAQINNVSDH